MQTTVRIVLGQSLLGPLFCAGQSQPGLDAEFLGWSCRIKWMREKEA
jgi:hypothetical protein